MLLGISSGWKERESDKKPDYIDCKSHLKRKSKTDGRGKRQGYDEKDTQKRYPPPYGRGNSLELVFFFQVRQGIVEKYGSVSRGKRVHSKRHENRSCEKVPEVVPSHEHDAREQEKYLRYYDRELVPEPVSNNPGRDLQQEGCHISSGRIEAYLLGTSVWKREIIYAQYRHEIAPPGKEDNEMLPDIGLKASERGARMRIKLGNRSSNSITEAFYLPFPEYQVCL